MGKSINPMFSFTIRGEARSGSAPSLIVLMSLQPAIPRQVALLQCPEGVKEFKHFRLVLS